MDRPKLEVADIFRRYGEAYRQKHGASLSTAQRRVMTAIEVCRTAALGGHLERCDTHFFGKMAQSQPRPASVYFRSRVPQEVEVVLIGGHATSSG
jgi:hypothetical protein